MAQFWPGFIFSLASLGARVSHLDDVRLELQGEIFLMMPLCGPPSPCFFLCRLAAYQSPLDGVVSYSFRRFALAPVKPGVVPVHTGSALGP